MSFSELSARIDAIKKLLLAAQAARRIPDQLVATAMNVRLEYGHSEPVLSAFKKVREQYAAEERRQGEIARDRELKRIAAEIDRLREDLPEIAIAARFALLDEARAMR